MFLYLLEVSMVKQIQYVTTEEKILSGANKEIIARLRSGLYPTISTSPSVVIITWDCSESMIQHKLHGESKDQLKIFIDHDHPQLPLYIPDGDALTKPHILSDGEVYDFSDLLSYRSPVPATIVISPHGWLTNHKDFRAHPELVLLYKPHTDNLSDISKEGLLNRVLLSNHLPTKVIWHTENLPKDIVVDGIETLKSFMSQHYPTHVGEIETFDCGMEELHRHLKASL